MLRRDWEIVGSPSLIYLGGCYEPLNIIYEQYDKYIDCQELCVGRRLACENLPTKGFDVRLGRGSTHKTGSQVV